MPNLICLGCKLPGVFDIFPVLWGQLLEKEPLEYEELGLVDPVIQRKQTAHLANQGRGFLVFCQGEGHQSLVSLEGVQGMELCETLLEG